MATIALPSMKILLKLPYSSISPSAFQEFRPYAQDMRRLRKPGRPFWVYAILNLGKSVSSKGGLLV